MKIFKILSIVILLSPLFKPVNAQSYVPFPKDSAEWVVQWHDFFSNVWGDVIYKMIGDTIVNGKKYSKVYFSTQVDYFENNGNIIYCLLREDSLKKIYIKFNPPEYLDTAEFVLYDFNHTIGDTIKVKCKTNIVDSNFNSIREYVITDTSTAMFFDNIKRKVFEVKSYDYIGYWIEGIGDNTHPFPCELFDYFGSFWNFELECFYQKDTFLFGLCNTIGIAEPEKENIMLDIFPTPAFDNVNIKFAKDGEYSITLFDPYGKKILKEKISGDDFLLKKTFENGVYIIIIEDIKYKLRLVRKLVFIN